MVDKTFVAQCRQAYHQLFDQLADPDGSNYPAVRAWLWQNIESRSGELSKHQQTQALSLLTDTLLSASLAAVAAVAMDDGDDGVDNAQQEHQRAAGRAAHCLSWVLTLIQRHPHEVARQTAIDVLGTDALAELCTATLPASDDVAFWGEVQFLGEAAHQRMFTLTPLSLEDPEPVITAMGIGLGLCTRDEVRVRGGLMRRFFFGVFFTTL